MTYENGLSSSTDEDLIDLGKMNAERNIESTKKNTKRDLCLELKDKIDDGGCPETKEEIDMIKLHQ